MQMKASFSAVPTVELEPVSDLDHSDLDHSDLDRKHRRCAYVGLVVVVSLAVLWKFNVGSSFFSHVGTVGDGSPQIINRSEEHRTGSMHHACWVKRKDGSKHKETSCPSNFMIYHHKVATVLSRSVREKSIQYLLGDGYKYLNSSQRACLSRTCFPIQLTDGNNKKNGLLEEFMASSALHDPQLRRRVVNFVRSPFQKIVSGYLYHMKETELWETWRIDKRIEVPLKGSENWLLRYYCSAYNAVHGLPSLNCDDYLVVPWRTVLYKEYELPLSVYTRDEHSRPLHAETYAAYLKRVPAREGLLVETMRAHRETIAMMVFARIVRELHLEGTQNICLEDMMNASSCNVTYSRIFQTLNLDSIGSNGEYTKFIQSEFCAFSGENGPSTSHGTDHDEHRAYLVDILRKLDETLFKGMLATFEQELQCGYSH